MNPNFKYPKKGPGVNSVDGMMPQNPKLASHQYYRGDGLRSNGPRQRQSAVLQPSRRRPHQPDPAVGEPAEDEKSPLLGDFTGSRGNVFGEPMKQSSISDNNFRSKPKERKRGRKDKKDKKEPGRLRTWWKNRSFKFKAGLISGLILIGLGGFLGIRLYSFLNSVFGRSVGNSSSAALSDEIDPSKLNTEGDGRLNVLLLGRGGTENEAPDLTDTILVASIDLKNQSASLLSIPRDMWVTVSGSSMKINAAFSTGKMQASYQGKNPEQAEDEGIKTAISAARNVAGVPIHKYVLTDYKAFRDVVNALGGVDVNVPEAIFDGFTGWSFKAGQQTMNGEKALQYARTRHGTARGDFDRSEHQRQLLVAMRTKATSTGIVANPVRLNSLANAVQKNIRTDLNLDEAKTVFSKTKDLAEANIKSLDLADPKAPLVKTGNVSGQSIVQPYAGLGDYSKIRAYARTNMIDPYLKQEAPTVAVYNGSNKAGVATLVGDVMAGYGYKVLTKETSKETQPKTLIIKMNKQAKKPFTERFLTLRFGTIVTSTLPTNVIPAAAAAPTTTTTTTTTAAPQPDYIIVLGTDFKTPTGPTW